MTNNYVVIETLALLQHRLGLIAVRSFHEDVMPLCFDPRFREQGFQFRP